MNRSSVRVRPEAPELISLECEALDGPVITTVTGFNSKEADTLPLCSKRIDILFSGHNDNDEKAFVIIELKQWEKAEATECENLVRTFVGNGLRDVTHPSYQAMSYKQILENMNTAIETHSIKGYACAYLHNYSKGNPEPLLLPQYSNITDSAPIFFRGDAEKLQGFLHGHVGKGDGMDILHQIEHGEIRPSKKLMDCVASLFRGRQEYVLLEEQQVAYSTIMTIVQKPDAKRTIIVKGGPGTGKSVVSLNAFREMIKLGRNVKFVAPNAAFRSVIFENLAGTAGMAKSLVNSLFTGSYQYCHSKPDAFDALIVDEAHRLKDSRAYQYQGENQVEDIIRASRVNVFFIDDSQRVRPEDIGSVDEIKRIAGMYNSEVHEIELEAQFRCAGAEGFINWLDSVLQLRETGNFDGWDKDGYEFRIVNDPNILRDLIQARNSEGYYSRLLAGYAWKWTSVKKGNADGEFNDISIPEYDFAMPWNSRSGGYYWAIHPSGENQVGCIQNETATR